MTEFPRFIDALPGVLPEIMMGGAFRAHGPAPGTPLATATDEFFENSWQEARDGVLARTGDRLQVTPRTPRAPSEFRFRFDRPYKRWADDGLELQPGPVRGTILYRRDILAPTLPDEIPPVAVWIDAELRFAHPNAHRRGYLCMGDLSDDVLLEQLLVYLVSLLSYQTFRASEPLNAEVAELFAADPEEAVRGLPPMTPLW